MSTALKFISLNYKAIATIPCTESKIPITHCLVTRLAGENYREAHKRRQQPQSAEIKTVSAISESFRLAVLTVLNIFFLQLIRATTNCAGRM